MLVLLFGASVLALGYWAAFAFQLIRTTLVIPTARRGLHIPLPDSSHTPVVAAFIPAHNEEACIATLARSLIAQNYPADALHAVFALDRCTDRTEPLLREALAHAPPERASRFAIHTVATRRDGWAGKTNALADAVAACPAAPTADYYLFADADTRLHPDCLRACLALMQPGTGRDLAMLSLLSTLTSDRWFERWVQPAAAIELIRQFPLVRANARDGRRPFANGQFILISRAAYDRAGGHAAVAGDLLEDIELARVVARAGFPTGVFLADGLLHCRMYADWPEFLRGWSRIYTEAANRKPARLRAYARRLRFTGALLPLAALLAALVGLTVSLGLCSPAIPPSPLATATAAFGAAGFVLAFTTIAACYALAQTSPWRALGYPLGAWLTANILRDSARGLESGAPTLWGGLSYVRGQR